MLIIPAIDLLGGNVVRLVKGDMDDSKTYSADPVETAKAFADMGVTRLHIVDLDGAKSGDTVNFSVIEKIRTTVGMRIEVGGGIRNHERLKRYFDIGVDYAILGTVVVKDPEFTAEALARHPGKIILGVDEKAGAVATEGWYESSDLTAEQVVKSFVDYEVESVIYTDIARDGMLTGINIDATLALADVSPFPIIASGGLKGMDDIFELAGSDHPNIHGCIVGKAFYEGRIDIRTAIASV